MSFRKHLPVAVAMAALCISSEPLLAQGGAETQDTTIDHLATYGAGVTYFSIGLSKHGNVTTFMSPAGVDHIRIGTIIEGYLVSSGAGNIVSGYDAADSESAWGTLTTSGSLAAGTLKITRKTADNKFLLTQQFTAGGAGMKLTITMTLKNISALIQSNVWLTRYADWDPNGIENVGTFYRSPLAVLATSGAGFNVLTSAQVGASPSVVIQSTTTGLGNFDQTGLGSFVSFLGVGLNFKARVAWPLGNLAVGASKSVKLFYQRL